MKILSEAFYAKELGFQTLEDEPLPGWLARRLANPILRGVALWWRGRYQDRVAVIASSESFKMFVLLERLKPRRKPYLVLLQFIPPPARPWSRRGLFNRLILAPVLRASVERAQVLSSWEGTRNAQMFGVSADRFAFIPWPLTLATDLLPDYEGRDRRVLTTGRALCDWPTVFAAAEGQDWDLEIVCSAEQRPLIDQLKTESHATIREDLALDECRALSGQVAVYLLAIPESEVSSGQIRVMDAIRGGTPLVAANVKGLTDYLRPGETALTFDPGDAAAARRAVNAVLADRELAERIRRRAFAWGKERTREQYLDMIRELIIAPESWRRDGAGEVSLKAADEVG